MAPKIEVRRARLKDAQTIANFVNNARPRGEPVSRLAVAERFSEVGFLLASVEENVIAMLGWQVENLIVRITDFLIAPTVDRVAAGRALVTAAEEEGKFLQAEAAILFLPLKASPELIKYWETLGYNHRTVEDLPRQWRDAAREWNPRATDVMVKQLREDLVRRPM